MGHESIMLSIQGENFDKQQRLLVGLFTIFKISGSLWETIVLGQNNIGDCYLMFLQRELKNIAVSFL
jgi:hypothetical protein